jgi:hypothetical protein
MNEPGFPTVLNAPSARERSSPLGGPRRRTDGYPTGDLRCFRCVGGWRTSVIHRPAPKGCGPLSQQRLLPPIVPPATVQARSSRRHPSRQPRLTWRRDASSVQGEWPSSWRRLSLPWMTEPGGSWWRSLDPASLIAVDAELGDRALSLAPHLSWLNHRSACRPIRSPGAASSIAAPKTCDASLTASNGSFSTQTWVSTKTSAPASQADESASAGVMWPRDSYDS